MKISKNWNLYNFILNKSIIKTTLIFVFCFSIIVGKAQNNTLPLNHFSKQEFQKGFSSVDSTRQTTFWPQLENQQALNSVYGYSDSSKYYYAFTRKLLRDHLVEVKGKDFRFSFDVLFDFQLGVDFADTTADRKQIFNNTRGFIIQGDLGKKVSFYTSVYENQARYANSINTIIDSLGAVPGQGRIKPLLNKDIGYDFNASYGVLSVQPANWLNLQFGHGKHFIGSGYRSLLMSDNAFNYPYLQASFLKKKIQYHFWYSDLRTLKRLPKGTVPESLFEKKSGNFYYLNYIPHPRVEIGIFESVIWQDWDSIAGSLPFEEKKLIPIIGINSLLTDFEKTHFGINTKIKITNHINIYGQSTFDGFSKKLNGYQLGFNAYNMGIKNLDFQFEFNTFDRFSYDSLSLSLEDISHFNQSLAHPLGEKYNELLFSISYRHKRWYGQVKYLNQEQFVSLNVAKQLLDIQASYLLNSKTNMNLTLGWNYREESFSGNKFFTQWLYFAFRTSLGNKYYDF